VPAQNRPTDAPPDSLDLLEQDIVFEAELRGHSLVFHSTWGLFSPRTIDEGTRLLVSHLEAAPSARCLDLGCGYGAIGLFLSRLCPDGDIHMVDKDFVAVEYARRNIVANGARQCQAYLSNGFGQVPAHLGFDLIAANLPANVGHELLDLLLGRARQRLTPGGRLYVVTISGLREYVRRKFLEVFGTYEKVKQGRTHTVALAQVPPDHAPASR
jgi:16S rRNA G1207 methylase RsmC